MRGMNHLNRLFFFIFRGRSHSHPPYYRERQERIAAALESLQVQTPQQIEWEKKHVSHTAGTASFADRSIVLSGDGSTGVLAQPSDSGHGADGGGVHSDGSKQPIVIENAPNWETLEKQLLEMLKDNPDITEVELKNDTTE